MGITLGPAIRGGSQGVSKAGHKQLAGLGKTGRRQQRGKERKISGAVLCAVVGKRGQSKATLPLCIFCAMEVSDTSLTRILSGLQTVEAGRQRGSICLPRMHMSSDG